MSVVFKATHRPHLDQNAQLEATALKELLLPFFAHQERTVQVQVDRAFHKRASIAMLVSTALLALLGKAQLISAHQDLTAPLDRRFRHPAQQGHTVTTSNRQAVRVVSYVPRGISVLQELQALPSTLAHQVFTALPVQDLALRMDVPSVHTLRSTNSLLRLSATNAHRAATVHLLDSQAPFLALQERTNLKPAVLLAAPARRDGPAPKLE